MSVNAANAVAAYSSTARAAIPTLDPQPLQGQTFANLVEGAAREALQVQHQAEAVAQQAAAGKADITEVVTAVANAEVTLQTVVAIRDKVVSAYTDIMRMPI